MLTVMWMWELQRPPPKAWHPGPFLVCDKSTLPRILPTMGRGMRRGKRPGAPACRWRAPAGPSPPAPSGVGAASQCTEDFGSQPSLRGPLSWSLISLLGGSGKVH